MRRRLVFFLCLVSAVLLLTLMLASIGKRIIASGRIPPAAMISGLSPIRDFVTVRSGVDSWAPMLAAMHQIEEHPDRSVYQTIFFERHIKFQYPLSSLLPLWAAYTIGLSDNSILALLRVATWIAVCIMAGVSAVIGVKLLKTFPAVTHLQPLDKGAAIVGIVISCVLFYPFMRGYELGQAQTFLSMGFAIALYFWMSGNYRVSGAIVGALVLVKPQYALILIWMILRKKTTAALAFLVCAAAGLLLSLLVFGWHQNMEYLRVLQSIGRQGESFYANQSVNGILHRMFGNGATLQFEEGSFAPFNRLVYLGTLISSALILGVALFFPTGVSRGTAADFSSIGLAATMASPVAWDHHYGILFPIFIWLFFGPETLRHSPLRTVALALAFILASDCLNVTNLLAGVPGLNLVQAYLFIAALVVFVLLATSSAMGGDEHRV